MWIDTIADGIPSFSFRPIERSMKRLYAVFQFGWTNTFGWFEPLNGNGPGPKRALLGVCRTRAKAVRAAARVRRLAQISVGGSPPSNEPAVPLIGVIRYDPNRFLTSRERQEGTLTRGDVHRRLMSEAKVWRARLAFA
jgi:hypothetical protein